MKDMTFNEHDHPRGTEGKFTDKANSGPEAALPQHARDLSDLMDFDHVITVGADGRITDDGSGLYAPDVYIDDNDPFWDSDSDWQVLRGFTGQHGYDGHVLHASEAIGGGLERHILDNPGHYVVVEVRDEDGEFADSEPVGWAVAFKPLDEPDYTTPRDEDVASARADLLVDIRNAAFPKKLTAEDAEALIDPERLKRKATRHAKDRIPERAFVDGTPLPTDEHFERIWAGEATGFGEKYVRNELVELAALRSGLEDKTVPPRHIVGTGYKNGRKIAFEYLDRMEATYRRAVEVRGRNLSVNVSNSNHEVRRAEEVAA